MEGLPLMRRIRELDEARAVDLAQSLVASECARLHLPIDTAEFSFRVKARDGGVDGRTRIPDDAESPFPLGRRLWQVKSGATPPNARREFSSPRIRRDREKRLVEVLRTKEWGYVLFWTNDPVDPVAEKTKDDFGKQLDAISPDIPRTFLFGSQVVDLVRRYPGVALPILGIPAKGMISPAGWAASFPGRLVADQPRDELIAQLRRMINDPDVRQTIRVFGDPGVGKSRLVGEAISAPDIADRALVATRAFDALELLAWVNADPTASVVVVVDGASGSDVKSLDPIVASAAGRVHVISVEDRVGNELSDARNLLVPPLEVGATKQIIQTLVSDGAVVDSLVFLCGGYPGLAVELAQAAAAPGAGEELAHLAESRQVLELLRRMIPADETRMALLAVAPFGRVDRTSLAEIAEQLELDPVKVAVGLDAQLGRLVSKAGTSRRVSPDIAAIWLTDAAIMHFGVKLIAAAGSLSPALVYGLLARLETLTGSSAGRRFVDELAATPRFAIASLDDVAGLRARFLSVMAVVHPASAMDLVDRLVFGASDAQLGAAAEQNDLTSALDELLWSPVTFERALACLYRLARAIPESNRYGPRHLFRRVYQLVLGGTYVPYQRRLEVARSLLAQADDPGRDLIVRAIGNALDLNYSRTISERGRLAGREDWLPQTADEARSVREESWRLLVQIANEHPSSRSTVGRVLAESLRSAYEFGLGTLMEETLPAIDWDAAARGRLLHHYRLLMDYDKNLTAEERASAERVETALQGTDFSARLAVVLAAEPHQILRLSDDGSPQAPDAMDLVVQEMVRNETNIRLALDQAVAGNPLMVETLFRRFGELQPEPGTYETVSSHQPRSLPAMIGFLDGCDAAGQTAWVDDRVAEWAELPDLRTHVPALVRALAASDERVGMALDLVETGRASSQELGFLRYGARATPLAHGTIARLGSVLAQGNLATVENGLGIMQQWVEGEGNRPDGAVVASALELVDRTLDDGADLSRMGHFLRARLLKHVPIEGKDLLPRVVRIVHETTDLEQEDLALVDLAAKVSPVETVRAIVGLVVEATDSTSHMWSYRVADGKLLSRLAATTGTESVIVAIERLSPAHPEALFDHVAVGGVGTGLDPMFEALLLWRMKEERMFAAAGRCFSVDSRVFRGPHSAHLEARRAEAERLSQEHADPTIRGWAKWVADGLAVQIDEAKRREEDSE